MATNIINIGFKGTYPSPFEDRTAFSSFMDNNDILYFLGTDYGVSSFSNPQGGTHLTTTLLNEGVAAPGDANTLTNFSGGFAAGEEYISEEANDILSVTFQFLTCKVNPSRIDLNTYFDSSTDAENWQVQGSNDGTNWIDLTTVQNPGFLGSGDQNYTFPGISTTKYFEYIRLLLSDNQTNSTLLRYRHCRIYGKLFRTDGDSASQRTPATTITLLPKYQVSNLKDNDYLFYDSGSLINKRNKIYSTSRLVLNADLDLDNSHSPNFYILDPNAATRVVNLPASPIDNLYFRIKTLDGSFDIDIDDGSGVIGTLNTSIPIVDLFWNGADWTIINYG